MPYDLTYMWTLKKQKQKKERIDKKTDRWFPGCRQNGRRAQKGYKLPVKKWVVGMYVPHSDCSQSYCVVCLKAAKRADLKRSHHKIKKKGNYVLMYVD